ncbi:MAG: succinylglutamate desuccinylase/aspartoacylase family protein [Rhodoferax sp.]|nr:succinylglutamate desuccinylase/aspartoacylase family protein [Rhodoferax sp.]
MPQPVSTTALRLHSFRALQPGPRLIVTGAVHGNEVCGSQAIERVAREFDSGALELQRGSLTLLPVTNPLAYERGQRNGDRNLNRNLYPNAEPQDYEDRIANLLCPLLAEHDVLLDLHSFHAPGEPFLMLGPQDNTGTLEPFAHAAREQALALRLGPRRIVEGWLETYADGVRRRLARTPAQDRAGLLSTDPRYGVGTTEYMRSQGGYALTLECGQHQDPAAPEVAWRAIHRTLAHLRLIDAPAPEPVARPQLLRLAMVVDKHHADDRFVKTWSSYDPVARGETIGMRHDGTPVQAQDDGFIVFPNAGASAGNEWFYFAQPGTRDLGT